MKFRKLQHWVNKDECASLVYFVQLMEELLFDYTLSTYKPSIMNVPSLCNEAISTIKNIEKGVVSPANINHVIEELSHNLREDDVAKNLLRNSVGSFLEQINDHSIGIKNLKVTLELLRVQINIVAYEDNIYEKLKNTIIGEFSPAIIRKLTRSLVTHLLAKGFSQEYLMSYLKGFFFDQSKTIISNEAIIDFLNEIPKEPINYQVYFDVEKSFKKIESSLDKLKIKIISELPEELSDNSFFQSHDQRIILCREVEAFDPYSARKFAENGLKLASTLLSIYHHKQEPTWSTENLVVNNKMCLKIKTSINPMHRCRDLMQEIASKKLEEFMNNFSMRTDSFNKFIRSAQLHSMALRSNAVENQLLNLWIAIESLIPDESKKESEATIEHLVNSMKPFLNIHYIENLIRVLIKDLLRWDYEKSINFFKVTGNHDYAKSLAIIMTTEKYQAIVEDYKVLLINFPLLKDRFEYIQALISDPQVAWKAIKNHEQRIDWQLKRIYRTRNLIVHTGGTPQRTNILVEHAHDYLDTVLNQLIKLASHPVEIFSVAQGFRNVEMKYKMYMHNLSKMKIPYKEGQVISSIFND